jgi:hypothetical protein
VADEGIRFRLARDALAPGERLDGAVRLPAGAPDDVEVLLALRPVARPRSDETAPAGRAPSGHAVEGLGGTTAPALTVPVALGEPGADGWRDLVSDPLPNVPSLATERAELRWSACARVPETVLVRVDARYSFDLTGEHRLAEAPFTLTAAREAGGGLAAPPRGTRPRRFPPRPVPLGVRPEPAPCGSTVTVTVGRAPRRLGGLVGGADRHVRAVALRCRERIALEEGAWGHWEPNRPHLEDYELHVGIGERVIAEERAPIGDAREATLRIPGGAPYSFDPGRSHEVVTWGWEAVALGRDDAVLGVAPLVVDPPVRP